MLAGEKRVKRIRIHWVAALFMLAGAPGDGYCDANGGAPSVLRSDEGGVVVAVAFDAPVVDRVRIADGDGDVISVEGCGWVQEVGRPQVPVRWVRVGIPFGVEPEVRMLSEEEGGSLEGLEILPVPIGHGTRDSEGFGFIRHEIVPDGEIYGRDAFFPTRSVEVRRASKLRFQRVVEVGVFPVRWNPATGRAAWSSEVTFEVTWRPGKEEAFTARAPEEPLWEGIYARVVVNARQARAWRRAPAPLPVGRKDRREEWKFEVPKTGLYRLEYGDLEGLDEPIPLSEIAVYRKEYGSEGETPYEEVGAPIRVVDDDQDGFFGESDAIYFWGVDFRDAFMVHDFEDLYADRNVYWVGSGDPGGEWMDTVPVRAGTPADTLRSFPERLWFEEDLYLWQTPSIVDLDGLPPRSDVDWWYWTLRSASGGTLAFQIFDPAPDSIPRLTVRFQGNQGGPHEVVPSVINGDTDYLTLAARSFSGTAEYFYETGDSIPPGFLTDGTNYFQFGQKSLAGRKAPFGAFLDWIAVRYARDLKARDGYLHFNTGDLEEGVVRVDGFSNSEIRLIDVTDPDHPVWVSVEEDHVIEQSGEYGLVLPESTAVRRAYVAFTPESAKRIPEPATRRSLEDPCWAREADYLLVSHGEFLAECERLASHRREKGLQPRVVSVEEVYDAFGGGIKHPLAIKRYFQWAFDRWSLKPLFAVLVGDGSDDHRGIDPDSGPDFVPSIHVMWVGEAIPADNWYADLDDDYLLDFYLGRLPAGSVSELAALVDKVIAYEQFDPADAWRGRILALSDDQCSTSSGISYRCLAPQEDLFETASRYSLAAAAASTGARLDTIGFYMSEYTGVSQSDGWHPLCFNPEEADPLGCMRTVVRDSLTPALFDILNEGVLLFQFQGHGHRKVMSHEYIVDDGQYVNGAYRYDFQDRLTNSGRPFILATFGCHFADFSQTAENDIIEQESLVEKALLLPDRGAIAGMGPVGFEEYRVARAYQAVLADVFFDSPPWVSALGETTGARWLLGELGAAMVLAGGLGEPGYRWVLLGDPALAIDALPPGITATVDGEPVTSGDFISARIGTDDVHIRVVIGDEVAVDTSSVRVSIREDSNTTWLERGSDYTQAVVDSISGGRVVTVEYVHSVRLETYDIVFEALDRNGLARSFPLKVGISFEPQFDGTRVYDGDYVSPRAEVDLTVTLPKAVGAEDLSVRIVGRADQWMPDVAMEVLDPDSTEWHMQFDLGGATDGSYTLTLAVETSELEIVRFNVEAELNIRYLTNYPNPFRDGTEFVFQLTRPAEVDLRIFSVTGKNLARFSTKGENGYNRIYWNGRDAEGDEVANGVYLYRIKARGGGEEIRSDIKRAVRMR